MGKHDCGNDETGTAGAAAVEEGVLAEYLTDPAMLAETPCRTDTLTPAARSKRMSRIHGKDTKPEMKIRHLVHGITAINLVKSTLF